jgi:hypothetical protein
MFVVKTQQTNDRRTGSLMVIMKRKGMKKHPLVSFFLSVYVA